jgi:hypothetical protein
MVSNVAVMSLKAEAVKKMRSLDDPSIFAGKSMMKATRTSSPTGT